MSASTVSPSPPEVVIQVASPHAQKQGITCTLSPAARPVASFYISSLAFTRVHPQPTLRSGASCQVITKRVKGKKATFHGPHSGPWPIAPVLDVSCAAFAQESRTDD